MSDEVKHFPEGADVTLTRAVTPNYQTVNGAHPNTPARADFLEANLIPTPIYISGNETNREIEDLKRNALSWEGPDVEFIVKDSQKFNSVPRQPDANQKALIEASLPTPKKILLGLLHDLGHKSLSLQLRESSSPPNMLVLSGAGSLAHALAHHIGHLTVVHPSKGWVEAIKAEPLSCKGTILKTMECDQERYKKEVGLFRCFSSVVYRNAPLTCTGLPSAAFDVVIIEQGQNANLVDVIAEAQRLSRHNGIIALVSYMPAFLRPSPKNAGDAVAVKILNMLLKSFFNDSLRKYLSVDERQVIKCFSNLAAPVRYLNFPRFTPAHETSDVFANAKCSMHADWRCRELLAHINGWSVVKRIDDSRHRRPMEVAQFRSDFARAWGPLKRRRHVTFHVVVKTAVVTR